MVNWSNEPMSSLWLTVFAQSVQHPHFATKTNHGPTVITVVTAQHYKSMCYHCPTCATQYPSSQLWNRWKHNFEHGIQIPRMLFSQSEQRYLFNVSWHLMFSLATTREWPTMSAGSSKLWSKGTSCQEVSAHKNRWKAIRISRSILWVELILNLRFTPNSNQWFQRHFSKSHIRRDSK